jgi:hypothetical protein
MRIRSSDWRDSQFAPSRRAEQVGGSDCLGTSSEGQAKLEAFDDDVAQLIAEAEELFGRPRQFFALDHVDIFSVRACGARRRLPADHQRRPVAPPCADRAATAV